jgi:hypothetical protein
MTDVPRLRFIWEWIERKSVGMMPREDWNAVVGRFGQPVEIDISRTPVGGVAQASSVVASVAHRFGPSTCEVAIFRFDAKDDPTPINQDKFKVWTNLAMHPQLPNMMRAASISDDTNLRQCLADHVFFMAKDRGADHWLSSVPSSITALLRKT